MVAAMAQNSTHFARLVIVVNDGLRARKRRSAYCARLALFKQQGSKVRKFHAIF
jgi:hypothetical protein